MKALKSDLFQKILTERLQTTQIPGENSPPTEIDIQWVVNKIKQDAPDFLNDSATIKKDCQKFDNLLLASATRELLQNRLSFKKQQGHSNETSITDSDRAWMQEEIIKKQGDWKRSSCIENETSFKERINDMLDDVISEYKMHARGKQIIGGITREHNAHAQGLVSGILISRNWDRRENPNNLMRPDDLFKIRNSFKAYFEIKNRDVVKLIADACLKNALNATLLFSMRPSARTSVYSSGTCFPSRENKDNTRKERALLAEKNGSACETSSKRKIIYLKPSKFTVFPARQRARTKCLESSQSSFLKRSQH